MAAHRPPRQAMKSERYTYSRYGHSRGYSRGHSVRFGGGMRRYEDGWKMRTRAASNSERRIEEQIRELDELDERKQVLIEQQNTTEQKLQRIYQKFFNVPLNTLKKDPEMFERLLDEVEDKTAWKELQEESHQLRLKQMRIEEELRQMQWQEAEDDKLEEWLQEEERGRLEKSAADSTVKTVNIVLICGFEAFNLKLYKKVARDLRRKAAFINLEVYSDRDIEMRQDRVGKAIAQADIFFGSLLFDFDTCEWLKEKVEHIPVRLIFESDINLMSMTQIGTFTMAMSEPGQKKGPPPAVKKILSFFGSSREEDKLVGYLSMLKLGPKLLKYVPGTKVRHLRNWLTVYNYWNQTGMENVSSMFLLLVKEYFVKVDIEATEVKEMPSQGVIHPDTGRIFDTPKEYLGWYEKSGPLKEEVNAPRIAILLYRKHVLTEQQYIPQMIKEFEQDGLIPIPIFINGVEAHTIVRDLLTSQDETNRRTLKSGFAEVDAIVSTIGFPLVGGPAGSMEAGRQSEISKAILESKNIPYVVAAPLLIQDLESWEKNGMLGLQSIVLYALPELDGAIDTVSIGGLVGDDIYLIPERVKRLTSRLKKWTLLRKKPQKDKKIAVLLYGFPPGVGATGTAALLNVPESLVQLLKRLREEGYDLGDISPDIHGEDIVRLMRGFDDDSRATAGGASAVNEIGGEDMKRMGGKISAGEVTPKDLKEWLSFPNDWGPSEWGPIPFLPEASILVERLESNWGELGLQSHISISAEGKYVVKGMQFGNVYIGIQPLLGVEGDPMRLLFERDLTPHPQYAAFYTWLQKDFQADAVIHFGTHGTVEWLPGSPLGNTGLSWSDVLLGNLPNIYVYTANNPSESIIAKRRGYGTIVSHNVPPYGRSGLYKQLALLKDLITDFREDPQGNKVLQETIVENVIAAGLFKDCPFSEGKAKLSVSDLESLEDSEFISYMERMFNYLKVVENRLFSEGLHVLGKPPDSISMKKYLSAYFDGKVPEDVIEAISTNAECKSAVETLDLCQKEQERDLVQDVECAISIRDLLLQNTEEIGNVVRALNGEYIPSVSGGDLLRDGPGVLPTGRNIHSLDPYRMPSDAAFKRGTVAAQQIIDQHKSQNNGDFPETIAVALWGLDSIKTKGDAVAIVLHLVGAIPSRDSTGRIARFDLIPLEELQRPRIDVIANMSGIFRDSFQNVVNLLDDLFVRAAEADEPVQMNFIRKHAEEMKSKGIDRPTSRLFSNPSGDYGSMVNERIGSSNWEYGSELGDTWVSRNAFSYGKGKEKGSARPEVLESLLSTTDRVVQEVDSVEYGLTDIQEYYANTGALRKAAETARSNIGRKGRVGCSIVECFGEEASPKELEDVLRLEYRSKLLNPKWAEAMIKQGSGGAFEISQRMTALLGWGATTDFKEDWVYDQATEYYVENEEVADALKKSNPQAFANILRRSIEAARRGIWDADEEKIERLTRMYNEMDAKLEGVE